MKNKSKVFKYEFISTIIIIILGVLLHFAYEWSGDNKFIGLITPVNESIWEHLKLLFFPTLVTIIIGTFIFKNDYNNYLCNKTWGLIIGMFFIVVFFYIILLKCLCLQFDLLCLQLTTNQVILNLNFPII